MAQEFIVPTDQGKVRIRVDKLPTDLKARTAIINAELDAGRFEPVAEPANDLLSGLGSAALQAAPSIVGGIAGGALGSLAVPITGPVGPIAGASLGAAAGEALTQLVDPFGTGASEAPLSEKALQIGMAGAAPGVAKGVGVAARALLKQLPGITSAMTPALQASYQKTVGKGIEEIVTGPASRDLFARLHQTAGGTKVGVQGLRTAAQELSEQAAKSEFSAPGTRKLAEKAMKLAGPDDATKGFVPLSDYMQNLQDLGLAVRKLEREGGRALGAAKKLYASMWQGLDDAIAAAPPGVGDTLRQAVATKKREVAAEMLADMIEAATSYPRGVRNVDAAALLKRVQANRETLQKLMPKEFQGMLDILTEGAKKVPNVSGLNVQAYNLGRVLNMGVGGGVGGAIGGLPGAAVGAALPELLTSNAGQRLVRFFLENGHRISANADRALGAGAQLGRSMLAPPMVADSTNGQPVPANIDPPVAPAVRGTGTGQARGPLGDVEPRRR